ncbi:MAG: response regulator transcription factor [Chitinophagales bacterium]
MLRMLIADDHPIVLQKIRQLLLESFPSASIELASDTSSLIRSALEKEWDIIISDLIMPGGGGLHALKKIKEVKPSSVIVIISIYPEEQYASRVKKEGAAAFLNKNNADSELVETVSHLLGSPIQ